MPDEEEQYLEFPVFNHPSFDTAHNKVNLDKRMSETVEKLFTKFDDSDSVDCKLEAHDELGFAVLTVSMYENQSSREKPIRIVKDVIYYYSPN